MALPSGSPRRSPGAPSKTRVDHSYARFACCSWGNASWFINTQSLSNDEPLHMIAGLEAWRYHRFERWNDHPPLVFLLCTLPLLLNHTEIDIQTDAKYADAITPSPEAMAIGRSPGHCDVGRSPRRPLMDHRQAPFLRRRRKFRPRAVRVLTFADRQLFHHLQRWRGGADHLRDRHAGRLLAANSVLGPNHRPRLDPGRSARHQVQHACHVCARLGSGAGPEARLAFPGNHRNGTGAKRSR